LQHWHEAVEMVAPYVVRISTPGGSGTGWLVSRSNTTNLCGVATAAHVISHAYEWDEPIRLYHAFSGESLLLKADDRAINLEKPLDSAAIVFSQGNLPLPEDCLALTKPEEHYLQGVEIGWLGFPAVASSELCFFSGRISAFLEGDKAYLVDGVAINGVSGGPAFAFDGDALELLGMVTAYVPNRATGELLPGVALVRDVTQFHGLVDQFRTFDEAKQQEVSPDEAAKSLEPEA
jgi:hypothetical protein